MDEHKFTAMRLFNQCLYVLVIVFSMTDEDKKLRQSVQDSNTRAQIKLNVIL